MFFSGVAKVLSFKCTVKTGLGIRADLSLPLGQSPNEQFCQVSRVMRKSAFCICENKDTDQLRSNSALIFATQIVQSFYFLNPKFQASYHLL